MNDEIRMTNQAANSKRQTTMTNTRRSRVSGHCTTLQFVVCRLIPHSGPASGFVPARLPRLPRWDWGRCKGRRVFRKTRN